MRRLSRSVLCSFSALLLSSTVLPSAATAHEVVCETNCMAPKIQIALLLDTSNSMDGLIDQTKSQLWMLVNELGETKHDGMVPEIELALYEYGNSNISVSKGYIRQVMSLTTDLDAVSEQLFALKTKGGQEYAGQVMATAIEDLEWSDDPADMKLMIIAGNEPFTQGPVHYRSACEMAREKGILIDTIHCGDEKLGIDTEWKSGADCGGGIYMTINQDEVAEFIPSPYDDEILALNKKLNKTYVGYGVQGQVNTERMIAQDQNAATMGVASEIARSKTKSSAQYKNESWDMVDAYKQDADRILDMDEAQLPDDLKGKTREERVAFIEAKAAEREQISKEIDRLELQRDAFVETRKAETREAQTIEEVVVSAVKKQAKAAGFE